MFSSFSIPFGVPKLNFLRSSGPTISIKTVEVYDVETAAEKRSRTLKHLIKANHVNHALLYHNLEFQNHSTHILGSAYILGASADQLNTIYDHESKELEQWHDAPGEISKDDWTDFLGKRDYQRAFVDFFEDQLVQYGYDWKALLSDYLVEGTEPLINNLIGNLGHPLIHLAYAYELSSREVAIESLAAASCFHNYLHKYIDDPSYSQSKPRESFSSVLDILRLVAADHNFDKIFTEKSQDNVEDLFAHHEALVLPYWNAWDLHKGNPTAMFGDSQKAAVALLVGTHKADDHYDFFLLHALTTSHAVRILLPLIPARYRIPVVRQWWLLVLAVYIAQLRPEVDMKAIEEYELHGRDWKWTEDRALKSKYCCDSHYVKGLRAMKAAAQTWGDADAFYLKAAVKFAEEHNGWFG